MNDPPVEPSDLFRFAQKTFHRLIGEFAAYGLLTNPRLELRQGNGLMCYTDPSDGNIYVLSLIHILRPEWRCQR